MLWDMANIWNWSFMLQELKNVWVVGYPVSWAPCCEWTKSWVPYCKWTWNILSRMLGGSFTCVYTWGPWAVEYLAKLSRILKMFSKSFKAMILGFNFIWVLLPTPLSECKGRLELQLSGKVKVKKTKRKERRVCRVDVLFAS